MTPLIEKIYTSGKVTNSSGREVPIHSAISREKGEFLYHLIKGDPTVRRTLEVGCANGLSTLHIGEALRGRAGARHFMLDPFQRTDWQGVGLEQVRQAELDFCELIEERSEFGLPHLAQAEPASFDFVLVDGWHTFDHTLIDAFYGLRLLRVGAYLVIDDCVLPPVAKAVRYLANYPSLEIKARLIPTRPMNARNLAKSVLGHPWLKPVLPARLSSRGHSQQPSMIAFRKTAEDARPWDWYQPF